MDQALCSLEERFKQFQNICCHCRKKFFKVEVDKILPSINYVTRKIKFFGYHIYRERIGSRA
ncbi:PREDICTED: uncharacterized protein LOC109133016 [Camelina sativa]|uniref:Uncharacterized protein LOC109133016 n=1 Tax=Camelina sativa TaxID=90675 RepID=A0ABM1RQ05_CAMSA|nr:PREDICTED: uncharacterized protein LOC109133016 [Camelina sativa]